MRGYIHSIKKIAFFSLGLVAYYTSVSDASMTLSGNWNYQNSKTGIEDISQNYGVSFAKNLALTEIMALDLGMRGTHARSETGTSNNYSPSVGYSLANDIFTFTLSGYANQTENSSSPDILSRNVAAILNSAWKTKGFVPTLSLNYHKSWQEDDLHTRNLDTDYSGGSVGLGWDFDHSKFNYNFATQENNNLVSQTQYLSSSHNARFATGASFLERRGRFSFSSQYNYSDSENSLPVEGGIANLKLNVSAYFAEVTGTSFSLVSSGNLTNSVLSDSVIVTDNNLIDFLTIAVRTNPSQKAHKIYLYIDSDDTLLGADAAKFTWDVYTSNNNTLWSLRESGATYSYNQIEKRFEISLSGYGEDYVAVRATTDADPIVVNFSEIEAYQEISATGDRTVVETDQTTITNDIGLTLQIKPNLQLTSNLSLIHSEYSKGANYRQTDLSSGLSWSPQEYLDVRLDGSIMARKSDGADEYQDRHYGISVAFPPMNTVDTILSVSRKEEYRASDKLSVISNYNLQALAEVYTDLDANLGLSYTDNDDRENGKKTGTSSSDLNLTARLVPGLVGRLTGRYSKSSGQASTYGSDLDLNWRISDIMSLRSGFNQIWSSGGDSSAMNLSVHVALTRNMQLSFNHRYLIYPDSKNDTSLDWHWTINKYFSLLTSGRYILDDNGSEDWNVVSRLNASFSSM